MVNHTRQGGRLAVLRNRPLLTLMLGHFTVDLYSGLLPVLYPLLSNRFALTYSTVGLVSLAYTGMSSITQPLFGWLADRYGTRLIGLALLWTASVFSTVGLATSFPMVLLLAGAAGIGSGMYHPLGALNAGAVIADRERNTAMSVYVTGGTVGVALGPLIGAILFSAWGMQGTIVMWVPGTLTAIWLLFEMRRVTTRRSSHTVRTTQPIGTEGMIALSAAIGVMMARSWTLFSIQSFIPVWYRSLGYSAAFYGPLTTTILLGTALGAIGAGTLADRFGKRGVTVISLGLSVPAVLAFAQFTGPLAFVTVALVGLLGASTGPLMLVIAQQLMAGRGGVASGLILGIGFLTGAIGVPVTGALADTYGMQTSMRLQAVVVALTVLIAWKLPSEERLRAMTTPAALPVAPATAILATDS